MHSLGKVWRGRFSICLRPIHADFPSEIAGFSGLETHPSSCDSYSPVGDGIYRCTLVVYDHMWLSKHLLTHRDASSNKGGRKGMNGTEILAGGILSQKWWLLIKQVVGCTTWTLDENIDSNKYNLPSNHATSVWCDTDSAIFGGSFWTLGSACFQPRLWVKSVCGESWGHWLLPFKGKFWLKTGEFSWIFCTSVSESLVWFPTMQFLERKCGFNMLKHHETPGFSWGLPRLGQRCDGTPTPGACRWDGQHDAAAGSAVASHHRSWWSLGLPRSEK